MVCGDVHTCVDIEKKCGIKEEKQKEYRNDGRKKTLNQNNYFKRVDLLLL